MVRLMSKKITILILSLLFLPLAGFGCKGLSQTERQATQPVALEYWTVFDDVDAIRALIEKYRAERPYLTVNVRQLRADEFNQRFIEALAEDRGPDIVSIHNRALRQYESKLSPMPSSANDVTIRIVEGKLGSQTIVNTRSRGLISPLQLDREYVQAVKNDVIIGGKIYGLPLSLDTMAVYYNKDLLDRAGVAEPPKNWEEFQAAVKKMTRYDRKTGRILQSGAALGTGNNIPNADDILYILFKQSGLDFATRNGLSVLNAVPQGGTRGELSAAMQVVNFYTDFANSTRDTYTWNEDMDSALDKFVNGSVGFLFGYSYHYPVIKARAPQLNVEILPLFQLNEDQRVNSANYWVQAVSQKSQRKNEAWALIDYLTHSEDTKQYLDATNRPTALRAFINAQSEQPELAPFVSQTLVSDNWYKGKDYQTASRAISTMLREWLQTPPDPDKEIEWRQEILNRAAARVNQTL